MSAKFNFTTDIKLEEEEIKVEKWDWNAVKNALDDAARKFITGQANFKEDHSLLNLRLVISTIAILIALYGIYDDWIHPFPESRAVLIICVITYFIAIGILTLYTAFVEKGCFAVAKQQVESDPSHPNKWKLTSKQKNKQDDVYLLELEYINGKTGKTRTATHEASVAKYFDENGVLCTKAYFNDLYKFLLSVTDEKKKN